jgi:U4/U6 small nuclear ribonucleoprotein PRP4
VQSAESPTTYHPETARLLAELDRKAKGRRLAVPTNDADVRKRLREFKEPITLFGERREDRRERLRNLMTRLGDVEETDESESEESDVVEEFYTEGTPDLLEARQWISSYSLKR